MGAISLRSVRDGTARLAAIFAVLGLAACDVNAVPRQDEAVKAAWSQVLNQYQRRADLIPNLVETVRGFAQQEQTVLLGVTEARSKVGSIKATPELVNDPKAFQQFQAAQGELTGALSRLMVVVEMYPDRLAAKTLQRLRVFKATMRTVQDIVNNLLNGLQLVHLEAEDHVSAETRELVDRTIQEAAVKLKALGDLETVTEKEMGLGLGIDYPGST